MDGGCAVITCGQDASDPLCAPDGCAVVEAPAGGTFTMTCPDGSTVTWQDGEVGPQGPQGPKGDKGDQGDPGADGQDGADGVDGTSCTVSTDAQGCAVVECTDGTQSDPVCPGEDGADGQDGQSCEPVTLPNGCVYVRCGINLSGPVCPGQDGADGVDGNDGESCAAEQDQVTGCITITCGSTSYDPVCPPEPCTVVDNGDGSFTMTCPDGSTVTWQNGENGPQGPQGDPGADGQGCEVTETNGVCTMVCASSTVSWDCQQSVPADQFDDDGDCFCEEAPCLETINAQCAALAGGDCNDTAGSTHVACYDAATDTLEVRLLGQGCPGGYTALFLTGAAYFINPDAVEVLDTMDNDCDGQTDEGFCAVDNDCDDPTPYCDQQTGECVACELDSQCDDGDACSSDVCNAAGACVYTDAPDGTDCADGLFCNGAEECNAGVCEVAYDPCLGGEICNEQTDTCEPSPVGTDDDGDGSVACQLGDPVGSCDCDDDTTQGGAAGRWCRSDTAPNAKFLMMDFAGASAGPFPSCPAGSTSIQTTDGSALNRPGMHDTVGDTLDNDCDGSVDEGGADMCTWTSFGGLGWQVSCPWMNP